MKAPLKNNRGRLGNMDLWVDAERKAIEAKKTAAFRAPTRAELPDPNAPDWMKSLSDRIVDRKKGLLQKMVAKSGDVAEMFYKFDADGSGYLDRKEFAAGLESLGFHSSNGEVDAICNLIDEDQSGEISLEEFQAFVVGSRGNDQNLGQMTKPKIASARGYDGGICTSRANGD